VTISGDQNLTTADSVTLSQVTVDLGGGSSEVRLAHNLIANGGTGNYSDDTDVDSSLGVARIIINGLNRG